MESLEVEAKNISKTYGDRKVVKDVSLTVRTSEVVGLLGPNGAGEDNVFLHDCRTRKSKWSGSIYLGNKEITSDPLYKSINGIGYLPQEASVFRELTVKENILAAAEVKGYSKSEKNRMVDQLIEDFNLQKIYKSLGRALSGGERRRVEIARVLALNPKFIFVG